MKKRLMKGTEVCLALLCPVSFCSCSGIQSALTFKIIGPKGGDSLTLVSYADDISHVSIADSEDVYQALFSTEYDMIIFDVDKGLDLIQKYHLNYSLARINTYGNAYLVGLNKDPENVSVSTLSNIVTYDYACSSYSAFSYRQSAMQNRVFKYINGFDQETDLYDRVFDNLADEYQYLLASDSEKVDYAILPEPYASRLIKADSSYSLMYSITSKYKDKTTSADVGEEGYAHYPQTGLFISSRLNDSDDRSTVGLVDNFFESYDNMEISLQRNNGSRVSDYIDAADRDKTYDPADYFGDSADGLYTALSGNLNPNGVNALGFCSYKVDLSGWYLDAASDSLGLVNSLFNEKLLSKYYN